MLPVSDITAPAVWPEMLLETGKACWSAPFPLSTARCGVLLGCALAPAGIWACVPAVWGHQATGTDQNGGGTSTCTIWLHIMIVGEKITRARTRAPSEIVRRTRAHLGRGCSVIPPGRCRRGAACAPHARRVSVTGHKVVVLQFDAPLVWPLRQNDKARTTQSTCLGQRHQAPAWPALLLVALPDQGLPAGETAPR